VTSRHPEPPKAFDSVKLLVRTFPASRRWFRIHRAIHDPLYFGRARGSRFDAPAGEFGVLYVGADAHCAFIESFGHATGTLSVSEAELRARTLSVVRASRELRLVDLRGEGLARMGADAELTSGYDDGLAQRWAGALHAHRRRPDGIVYRARHDPQRSCAALFERVAPWLTATRTGSLLDAKNVPLLGRILDTYRFALVP
jgi:hypothetical protein